MRISEGKIKLAVLLSLAVALIASCGQAHGQTQTGSGQVTKPAARHDDRQFQNLINSVRGPDLSRAYCASCHGADARATGPQLRL